MSIPVDSGDSGTIQSEAKKLEGFEQSHDGGAMQAELQSIYSKAGAADSAYVRDLNAQLAADAAKSHLPKLEITNEHGLASTHGGGQIVGLGITVADTHKHENVSKNETSIQEKVVHR